MCRHTAATPPTPIARETDGGDAPRARQRQRRHAAHPDHQPSTSTTRGSHRLRPDLRRAAGTLPLPWLPAAWRLLPEAMASSLPLARSRARLTRLPLRLWHSNRGGPSSSAAGTARTHGPLLPQQPCMGRDLPRAPLAPLPPLPARRREQCPTAHQWASPAAKSQHNTMVRHHVRGRPAKGAGEGRDPTHHVLPPTKPTDTPLSLKRGAATPRQGVAPTG